MINPLSMSFIMFLLSTFSLVGIYKGWLPFSGSVYFFTGLILAFAYFVIRRTHESDKNADRLSVLSLSFFLVAMVSGFVNNSWKLTNVIEVTTVTKVFVVLLAIVAIYLNFVYIRAEQSYKKKRGNQRIREQPKQGLIEQIRSNREKEEEEDDDVVIILGRSADNPEEL